MDSLSIMASLLALVTGLLLTVVLLVRKVLLLKKTVREQTQSLAGANAALNHEIKLRRTAEKSAMKAEKAAETADQAKSAFIANVSHELRTPLNGILGYANILKQDAALTEKQQKAVNIIHRSGEHLLMVINDILDLSRIELRKIDLHLRDFSLPRFLESIADMIQVQAKGKELVVKTYFDPALPRVVRGDEVRLRQILLNLLGNAVKYTEKGHIDFTAKFKGESYQYGTRQASIRLEVADTGVGIHKDNLKSLFKPFERVNNRKDAVEGTGLGLAISSRLVQMMKSRLYVKSVPGEGSLFWFTIELPMVGEYQAQEEELDEDDVFDQTIEEGFWVPPPAQDLKLLHDLAMKGDVRAIQEQAEALAASSEWAFFGQKVLQYAKALMIDELQEFIGKFMEDQA